MLTVNRLQEKLRTGQEVVGLIASIPAALTVEMIGHAGYDFVIIDMEHVMVNPETVEHMIRAAEAAQITPLVRVPEVDAKEILRVLDSGAQGIVVPHVESREQMEMLVQAAKYSPEGKRSLNSGRPAAFGKGSLVDYMKQANEQIMLVPMIESGLGVERIADILSVPGMGMVLEGAADLSQSYGVPWQTDATIVQEGLQRVFEASQQAGIPYCAIPRRDREYGAWVEQGVHAFVLGDERGIAFRALQKRRSDLQ
ncbi:MULTISPECIES: HpcH/HpaI aldolase/citrate lyase family protein [unclassified Paenibacillus]|uniref:HpcH/HpaI aldolase family protein n=1 Tax=unclassified Paenibacillus TaxID=185978 RepID=UPI0024B907F8|nr:MULTISPECIES: aldolase/citrate lyase family protein [unclassified Paenibacillus]